jgi:hypothetical protein
LVTRRVKPARSLAFRRTPPGFRLAPAWPFAFRRPAARFRLTPARSFTFRRPAARFRLTPGVAVAKTAVVPPPSRVATS